MPAARAPGRVTIIGDHTDYNGGLSLPMAIDLATEVEFTPKPGSFLVGIDSDQFPGRPLEIALGDTAPVPPRPPWRPGSSAAQPPPSGGAARVTSTLPVGAGLSSSAAFSVALLLALGHDPDPLALARACQEAERSAGAHVGLLDPLAIAGRRRRARAAHRLRHARAPDRWPIPDDAAFVIVHSETPRLLDQHPVRHPARRVRAGRAHPGPAARRCASSAT